MTAESPQPARHPHLDLGHRLAELVPEAEVSVSGGEQFARATVDVPPARWPEAVRAARDDPGLAMDFLDWLSAVDELEDGFRVVVHLWSTGNRHGVLIRTLLGRDQPALGSVVDLYPGAAWHEREAYEMFGISFTGHPNLVPLLLPPEFEGHPLRKEFVLASRVAKPWPGAKEPGQGAAGRGEAALGADSSSRAPASARRQPMRPPGVPTDWGPTASGQEPAAPRRPATARPDRGPGDGRREPEASEPPAAERGPDA